MWHRKMERERPAINGEMVEEMCTFYRHHSCVEVASVFAPSMTADQKDWKTTAIDVHKNTTENKPKQSKPKRSRHTQRKSDKRFPANTQFHLWRSFRLVRVSLCLFRMVFNFISCRVVPFASAAAARRVHQHTLAEFQMQLLQTMCVVRLNV